MKEIKLIYDIDMYHTKFADSVSDDSKSCISIQIEYPTELEYHHTEEEILDFFKWYLKECVKC